MVEDLGLYRMHAAVASDGSMPSWLFTENDTNSQRLFNVPNDVPYKKDAIPSLRYPARVGSDQSCANGHQSCCTLPHAYCSRRASDRAIETTQKPLPSHRMAMFLNCECVRPTSSILRWSKQIQNMRKFRGKLTLGYSGQSSSTVTSSKIGCKVTPAIRRLLQAASMGAIGAEALARARHFIDARQMGVSLVRSVGHCVSYATMAETDPEFAKDQMLLFLREWYLHPNGQFPAYEWTFSDVNPPVHAWACWRIYKISAPRPSAIGLSWSVASKSCC